MRAMMNNSWTRAARCAALAALLCGPQMSWGQSDFTSGPGADFGSLFAPLDRHADPIFDQYASLNRLASAWKEMDSALMTDAALQFAEGERVLLRSHKLITASQAFDLAIRMATENKDKESLARLAKASERNGDKERLANVNLALKTAGAARTIDPALKEGKPDAQLTVEAVQAEVRSARVAASKAHLVVLDQSLVDLSISDQHRVALKKEIASATDSVGAESAANKVVEELDFLAGIGRPIEKVEEPTGGKFYRPNYEDAPLNEDGFLALVREQKEAGFKLNVFEQPMAKLGASSRGNEIVSKYNGVYGRSSIWQWVNSDGLYKDTNCGQAAFASIMTYWKFSSYPSYKKPTVVRMIETDGYGPDVPAFSANNPFKINFGGGGTSPRRMQSIADKYKFNYYWQFGATEMEKHLKNGWPVVVLLDIANNKAGSTSTFNTNLGYHWVVVFAYDSNNYYCTNWGGNTCAVSKAKFDSGWYGGVHTLFGINRGFMMAWPK